jgi:hypothetical protein
LPQMKGKGAVRDRTRIEAAIKIFADAVAEHIIRSNMFVFRGPSLNARSDRGPQDPDGAA